MVLQVLPHRRQVMQHRQAHLPQVVTRTDAGQHQQLRRTESACRQDHLAPGQNLPLFSAAAIGKPRRAAPVEQHTRGLRPCDHMQIRALHHRMQIGRCRRTPLPLVGAGMELRDLIQANPLIVAAVEILGHRLLHLPGGFDKGAAGGAGVGLVGHLQGTVGAMQGIGTTRIPLGPQEIRQHIVPTPAGGALFGPTVIILPLAPDIQHGIDRR